MFILKYYLFNKTLNIVIAKDISIASSYWQRLAGLLGKSELLTGQGLLLVPCNSVHTMFMRYPIDVLFLSRDFVVLKAVKQLKPWRLALLKESHQVVELKAGTITRSGVSVGDVLDLLISTGQ